MEETKEKSGTARSSHDVRGELTIEDHTIIMRAVLEHRGFLLDAGGFHEFGALGLTPPPRYIFEQLLKAPGLDTRAEGRIRVLIEWIEPFEKHILATKLGYPERLLIAQVARAMRATPTTSGKIRVLSAFAKSYREDRKELAEAFQYATQILEHGMGIIYSETTFDDPIPPNPGGGGNPPSGGFPPSGDSPGSGDGIEGDPAGSDVVGAINGAIGGALGGPFGVGLGAVIGAIISSTIGATARRRRIPIVMT